MKPNYHFSFKGWNIRLQQVEGRHACETPLGACGPAGDCVTRCKELRKNENDGEGSCTFGLCNCVHGCP